jgi:hypothetical protein
MIAKDLLTSLKTWQLALCVLWDMFATANRLRQKDRAIRVGSLEDDGGMTVLLLLAEAQK